MQYGGMYSSNISTPSGVRSLRVGFLAPRPRPSAGAAALGAHEAVVGRVGQPPVLRAVHAVVAAHDRADAAAAHLRHDRPSLARYSSVLRGGVSRPSRKGWITISPSRVLRARAAHDLEEVLLVRVHALVLQQAQQVQPARALACQSATSRFHCGDLEQRARAQPVVDALQLLDHDAAGAHVEVPHLARPLVAVGQPHGLAGAVQERPGVLCLVARRCSAWPPPPPRCPPSVRSAPPVPDNQRHRSSYQLPCQCAPFSRPGTGRAAVGNMPRQRSPNPSGTASESHPTGKSVSAARPGPLASGTAPPVGSRPPFRQLGSPSHTSLCRKPGRSRNGEGAQEPANSRV